MNRRAFLATTAAGAAVAAFPAILKAQGGDTIKVGFPGPTTGPFGALAKDQQQGASVAMEEINAKGGILGRRLEIDRKSTRLNSSHLVISYAVFCLKKKKKS